MKLITNNVTGQEIDRNGTGALEKVNVRLEIKLVGWSKILLIVLQLKSAHNVTASGRTVIQIESVATGETVDQIPNEDLLRLYASIRQPLVDETA